MQKMNKSGDTQTPNNWETSIASLHVERKYVKTKDFVFSFDLKGYIVKGNENLIGFTFITSHA